MMEEPATSSPPAEQAAAKPVATAPSSSPDASASYQTAQDKLADDKLEALELPLPKRGALGLDAVELVCARLHAASWAGMAATALVLPPPQLLRLIQAARHIVKAEPTLLELTPSASQQRVTVVGDTHGQFHDLCGLFELFGAPSQERVYIFNGDYVDRGAWGVETLALLLAYKWALPQHVFLLRGNHEASFCTMAYGFKNELSCKYGAEAGKALYKELKQLFAALPLAAVVEHNTLILHGGLFRAPPPPRSKSAPRSLFYSMAQPRLGTLADLRAASKGGVDPNPDRPSQLVASDVTWSDPSQQPGHHPNWRRGVGTTFGADITEAFLSANGLRLIIRSHEGPDARDKRPATDRMPDVQKGYAVDHDTPSGRLVTLFSAPDYPQFMAEGEQRYRNQGAVLHLSAPDYATPDVQSFDAVLPRPEAQPFYSLDLWESSDDSEDEESLTTLTSPHATPRHEPQQEPPTPSSRLQHASPSSPRSPRRGAGSTPRSPHCGAGGSSPRSPRRVAVAGSRACTGTGAGSADEEQSSGTEACDAEPTGPGAADGVGDAEVQHAAKRCRS